MGQFGLALLILLSASCASGDMSLDTFLLNNPGLTDFFDILKTSPYMKSALSWKSGTLFVPTNEAVSDFRYVKRKELNNMTLLYHFSNVPVRLTEFENEKSISTELPGYAPIWITRTARDGLYLNNAHYRSGNLKVKVEGNTEQVIHILDQVLEPTIPDRASADSAYLHNPDAKKFLAHASAYRTSENQLTTIYQTRVSQTNQTKLFSTLGVNTFLIPVDSALKDIQKKIDATVIDAHMIPGQGIFLRAAGLGKDYETYKVGENNVPINSTITVSFERQKKSDGITDMWLVKSDNRLGDGTHRKGVVQAEILKGNIPVKNGVVHLLSKALVVIDTDVYQTLEWYANRHIGSMKKFYEVIRGLIDAGYGNEIQQLLKGKGSGNGITLFVPSNKAIESSSDLQMRKTNGTAMMEILKTHILKEAITTDEMVKGSRYKRLPFQVATMEGKRKVLFSSFEEKDGNRTVHLEGGGVNASIVQPDFGATNGFIHIIDHVLGIPDQTISEKLRSHPMLQSTFHLWKKSRFEERFNHTHYPITFFAPSEMAWANLRRLSDSAYHNLFDGDGLNPLLIDIIERHIILEQELRIGDLIRISARPTNVTLPKVNGTTVPARYPIKTLGLGGYVKVNQSKVLLTKADHSKGHHQPTMPTMSPKHSKDDTHYYVYWDRIWALVIRPNVKCTNGYLHIIDDVLMDGEEIRVASAGRIQNNLALFIPAAVILISLLGRF